MRMQDVSETNIAGCAVKGKTSDAQGKHHPVPLTCCCPSPQMPHQSGKQTGQHALRDAGARGETLARAVLKASGRVGFSSPRKPPTKADDRAHQGLGCSELFQGVKEGGLCPKPQKPLRPRWADPGPGWGVSPHHNRPAQEAGS